jgi:two-component system response regulator EvgA
MLTAIVVDDHPFIRSAVKELLKHENIEVVAETDNGTDAVQLARQYNPALMVLDISIPKLDGLEVMDRIWTAGLMTKVIILTSHSPDVYCRRCIKVGASGFISKTGDLNELSDAVRAVRAGYTYFPDFSCSSVCKNDSQTNETELIAKLSNRELSVLQHLAKGASNKIISEELLLSTKTVSTYKNRLIEKLNVKSLVFLADFARRNNLI